MVPGPPHSTQNFSQYLPLSFRNPFSKDTGEEPGLSLNCAKTLLPSPKGTPLGHTSLARAVPPHTPAHPCARSVEFPGISSRKGTAASVTAAADGRSALQRCPPGTESPVTPLQRAGQVPSPHRGHSQAAGFAEGTGFIPGIWGFGRRGHPQVAADVELAGETKENSLILESLGLFFFFLMEKQKGGDTSPNSRHLRRI